MFARFRIHSVSTASEALVQHFPRQPDGPLVRRISLLLLRLERVGDGRGHRAKPGELRHVNHGRPRRRPTPAGRLAAVRHPPHLPPPLRRQEV